MHSPNFNLKCRTIANDNGFFVCDLKRKLYFRLGNYLFAVLKRSIASHSHELTWMLATRLGLLETDGKLLPWIVKLAFKRRISAMSELVAVNLVNVFMHLAVYSIFSSDIFFLAANFHPFTFTLMCGNFGSEKVE